MDRLLLLTLLPFFSLALLNTEARTSEPSSWETGAWGRCWSVRGCGTGSEERTVWCGDVRGRPLPPALCDEDKRPHNSRPCYLACKGGSWVLGGWSPCQVDLTKGTQDKPLQEDEKVLSEHLQETEGLCSGVHYRNVSCAMNSKKVHNDLCPQPMPPLQAPCALACPQDCVVGSWSAWSVCTECGKQQTRERTPLVSPTPHGQECPSLHEERPCPCATGTPDAGEITSAAPSAIAAVTTTSINLQLQVARLRVGEWGPCKPPHDTLMGSVQESTQNDTPQSEEKKVKSHQENSIAERNPVFSKTRVEAVSISDDEDENDLQTLIQMPAHRIARDLEAISSAVAEAEVLMDEETMLKGVINTDQGFLGEMPLVGSQERHLSCVHANGSLAAIQWCLAGMERGAARVRTCVVSRDCLVTQWSDWTTVIPGCVAPSGQVVREVRERKRVALALQHGEGIPCPHLMEKHTLPRPSLQPCDTRYQWVSSAWGECVADLGGTAVAVRCGGGIQRRQLTCVRTHDHVPVDNDLCRHVEQPPRVQRCEVGCERDCQVGPWSAWGVCTPTDCTVAPPPATPGFQRRRREVVVSPSSGGQECPAMEEQSECHEAQCHQWRPGPWSPCLLENPTNTCGPGHQSRNLTCLDAAGANTPPSECEDELGTAASQRECHIPCSFDCVTGMWSAWTPCSRPCASRLHVGYSQRNTSIIAPQGQGGLACPAPDELTQVTTCRVEPCGGAAWRTGPWQTCHTTGGARCGPGRQIRTVHCVDHHNYTLPTHRCSGLTMLPSERECDVSCGNDCTVTSWSQWSPCLSPESCSVAADVAVASSQKRWRRILVPTSGGGTECPALVEQRDCARAPGSCNSHTWSPQPWSICTLTEQQECGTGFRVRRVDCVDALNNLVEPSLCLLGDTIVPETSQECYITCDRPCVTTPWSEWKACDSLASCSQLSTRTRELIDGSAAHPACADVVLIESRECPCHSYFDTAASPWSECIVETSEGCGVGKRYHSLLCTRQDGILHHPSSCGHSGLESEPCMLECPSDCHVGPWYDWTPCNATCGAGIQARRRMVEQPGLWGGRNCPVIEQTRACWGACAATWVPGGWNDCRLSDQETCGTGTQDRIIRCMREASTGLLEEVSELECGSWERPWDSQDCTVTCPGNCVVGPWAEWTVCDQGCNSFERRKRRRSIVRHPAGDATSCPTLLEEEPCTLGSSCWRYKWEVGNWTSCVPLGHSTCGEGVRNRPVFCTRGDGTPVHDRLCLGISRPTPVETWCYVDCPIDCEVTSWTEWDSAKCSCGDSPGVMTRRRFLSVNPSESGRPCPRRLEEHKPCPALPCYTWERGPWSPCQLEGGSCGHGMVSRRVSCMGPGGQEVTPKLCLALVHVGGHTWPYLAKALDLNTQDGCYVPCEGDCELTEWATWSHCHRDCSKGHQGGTQTRTRAILKEGSNQATSRGQTCPGPLSESRPCLAGPCLNYTWEVHNNTVHCIRSDGMLVHGGCEGKPKPCVPECVVRGSLCSAVGACVCRPGLHPRYSEKQRFRLAACVPSLNISYPPIPQPLAGPKYLPEDINIWMFAMVGVGSAFVVFVVISMYLLCQSPREQTAVPMTLRRQKNVRHRPV